MKVCKSCKEEIKKKATKCPHCQTKQGMGFFTGLFLIFAVLVVASLLIDTEETTPTTQPQPTVKKMGSTEKMNIARGACSTAMKMNNPKILKCVPRLVDGEPTTTIVLDTIAPQGGSSFANSFCAAAAKKRGSVKVKVFFDGKHQDTMKDKHIQTCDVLF